MDLPLPIALVLCFVLVLTAVPCCRRLASDDPSCCGPGRAEDAAELLICLGMLAMVSPLGAPIPLAGWRAMFAVAVVALAVRWVVRRRPCGHHAIMAAAMLFMFAAMHSRQGAEPWLALEPHALGVHPLAVAVLVYCAFEAVRSARAREAARGFSAATMGVMTLAMM